LIWRYKLYYCIYQESLSKFAILIHTLSFSPILCVDFSCIGESIDMKKWIILLHYQESLNKYAILIQTLSFSPILRVDCFCIVNNLMLAVTEKLVLWNCIMILTQWPKSFVSTWDPYGKSAQYHDEIVMNQFCSRFPSFSSRMYNSSRRNFRIISKNYAKIVRTEKICLFLHFF